ncbi:MAG: hypothetical protein ACRD68_18930, partial [Pyrinomonadaceae bacterium]
SDDDAVLLIGHELTHVAARGGRLRRLIREVSDAAKLSAGVTPGKEQEEDLACEYVGVQVLKRYLSLHPMGEPASVRLARALNGPSPAEQLEIAWENFCATYDDEAAGDDEHLSTQQTIRALLGIDPELQTLMLEGPVPADAGASIVSAGQEFTGRVGATAGRSP